MPPKKNPRDEEIPEHIRGNEQQENDPKPLAHFVRAFFLFREITGRTPYSVVNRSRNADDFSGAQSTKSVHRRLYNAMVQSRRETVGVQLQQRFEVKGLNWNTIQENLKRMPSSVPQTHRSVLMRFLLNGLPTSRRMRFVNGATILDCPFCGSTEGDNVNH